MEAPAINRMPTISAQLSDGTLIELIYSPDAGTTALAVREPNSAITLVPEYTGSDGIHRVPYSPSNNLLTTGCVLLPSDIEKAPDTEALACEIQSYLSRYVQLSPSFAPIAAYFVLLSWVYDAFGETPYLRLRGDYGSGKTRGLIAIGSVCYKPFFASGASTVSPIFHILDAFQGTLVLDEADMRWSDATCELTKVLNNGTTRGLPVLRTMTTRHRELSPTAFRVFGPKIVAMREAFDDDALESRFLTEHMGAAELDPTLPLHLPDSLAVEARALRNRLLAWRFHNRQMIVLDPARAMAGVEPRVNQMALPLLSVVPSSAVRADIVSYIAAEHARRREARSATELGEVVRVIMDEWVRSPRGVAVGTITDRLSKNQENFEHFITSRSVGHIVRAKLGLRTEKAHGVYIIPRSEHARVAALAVRYAVAPPVACTRAPRGVWEPPTANTFARQ